MATTIKGAAMTRGAGVTVGAAVTRGAAIVAESVLNAIKKFDIIKNGVLSALATFSRASGGTTELMVSNTELVTNGGFSAGTTGWVLGAGFAVNAGAMDAVSVSAFAQSTVSASVEAFKKYLFTYECDQLISGSHRARVVHSGGTNAFSPTSTSTGQVSVVITPTLSGSVQLSVQASNLNGALTARFRNFSLREVVETGGTIVQAQAVVNEPRYRYAAVTNLLTRSNDFASSDWSKSGASAVTQTGLPDALGGNSAFEVNIAAASDYIRNSVSIASGAVGTFSLYVRRASSGSATKIRLTTNNTVAWNTGISTTYTLTDTWTRVVVSGAIQTGQAAANILFGGLDAAGAADAGCVGKVQVCFAQVELAPSAGTYVPTAASAATGYFKEVLLEGAATNFTPNSSDLTSASWVKRGAAQVASDGDGFMLSGLGNFNGLMGTDDVYQQVSGVPAAVALSRSLWVKRGTNTGIVRISDGYADAQGVFDVDMSKVSSADYERVFAGHPAVTITTPLVSQSSGTTGTHIRSNNTGTFFVKRPQLETGSIATSYIPTTSAPATRAAELCSIPAAAIGWNPSEGTFVAEHTGGIGSIVNTDIAIGKYVQLGCKTLSPTGWYNNNVPLSDATNGFNKSAIAFDSVGNFAASRNGGAVSASNASDYTGAGVTTVTIGSRSGSALNGSIRNLDYRPRKPTNTELQQAAA